LLYDPDDYRRLAKLQRALAERPAKQALTSLLQLLEKHPTNAELIQTIPI
jgi:transcription termination factor Rho